MPVPSVRKLYRRILVEKATNEHRIRKAEGSGERVYQRDVPSPQPVRYPDSGIQDLVTLVRNLRELTHQFNDNPVGVHSFTSGDTISCWDEYHEYRPLYSQSERQERVQDALARTESHTSPSHHYYPPQYREWVSLSSAIRSTRPRSQPLGCP